MVGYLAGTCQLAKNSRDYSRLQPRGRPPPAHATPRRDGSVCAPHSTRGRAAKPGRSPRQRSA